jgi:hypothetical protein
MNRALHEVRSLWFPSLREMRAWDVTTSRLYVRWQGDTAFEIGPRLVNQQAARFCPVIRGELSRTEDGRTRVQGRRETPTGAAVLLLTWAVVLVVWAAIEVPRVMEGTVPAGAMFWWALAVAGTVVTARIGAVQGGRELQEALPDLTHAAGDARWGQDDW